MKVCHTLICFFFLTALQDGDTEKLYRGEEGTNITVSCSFRWSGSTRFFCKETCEGKNILIETTEDRAQRGRYSIQYENNYIWSSDIMNVSITGLKTSDSGKYRCRLDRMGLPTRHDDFELVVTEEPDWTPSPSTSTFLSSASLTTTATLTQRLSSSSSSSPETSQQTRTSTGPKDLLLYVGLILALLIFMLAAALLIFFRRNRFSRQKTPPVETGHADNPMTSMVYEEITEEDKPSPGEISAVYANCCDPDGAGSAAIYSLADSPQNTAQDDGVEYSEVHLLNNTTSSNSAPSGRPDNDSHPLYSTVNL